MNEKRYYQSSWMKRYRVLLLLLLMAVLVPVAIALYFMVAYPRAKSHHLEQGYKIVSPVSFYDLRLTNRIGKIIPAQQWHHKWVMFYVLPGGCNDVCHAMLEKIKRVVSEQQGSHHKPIDVIVTTFSDGSAGELNRVVSQYYRHFIHVYVSVRDFRHRFTRSRTARLALFEGLIYVINPKGKVVTAFNAKADYKTLADGLQKQLNNYQD